MPGLPFPEEDNVYQVFGYDISSSDLGNQNYALVGKALDMPETLLLQQAGAAQLRDHPEHPYASDLEKLYMTQIESMQRRDRGYGDQFDDPDIIGNGFDVYKSLFRGVRMKKWKVAILSILVLGFVAIAAYTAYIMKMIDDNYIVHGFPVDYHT